MLYLIGKTLLLNLLYRLPTPDSVSLARHLHLSDGFTLRLPARIT